MKRLIFKLFLLIATVTIFSCGKSTEPDTSNGTGVSGSGSGTGTGTSSGCGTYNGHTLYKGSSGGCYYINSNGNKTYVDRDKCHC